MRMTIGELSRRTGVPVRALREYEDMGLIYTVGRSPGIYRLFDESALWCVGAIRGLRSLELTVAEIREIAGIYLGRPDQPIGPHLAGLLHAARARIDARIDELQQLPRRSTSSRPPTRPSSPGRATQTSVPETRGPGPPALDPPPGGRL